MPHLRVNAHHVLVTLRVALAQVGQHALPFPGDLVAFVRAVLAAHEQAEADVAQVVRLGVVRMPGHHRGRRPSISHTRCELIDAITPSRVAHEINTVRIHAASRHVILDQAIKQTVDVRLMPQIPSVSRRARRDVNPLGRLVELDLVFPLTVVHSGRRTAAAVH